MYSTISYSYYPLCAVLRSVTAVPSNSANSWTVADQAPLSMGLGWHALLQGIFPIQESNPYLRHLLHCGHVLYPLSLNSV